MGYDDTEEAGGYCTAERRRPGWRGLAEISVQSWWDCLYADWWYWQWESWSVTGAEGNPPAAAAAVSARTAAYAAGSRLKNPMTHDPGGRSCKTAPFLLSGYRQQGMGRLQNWHRLLVIAD